jgi:hypothetical protein
MRINIQQQTLSHANDLPFYLGNQHQWRTLLKRTAMPASGQLRAKATGGSKADSRTGYRVSMDPQFFLKKLDQRLLIARSGLA